MKKYVSVELTLDLDLDLLFVIMELNLLEVFKVLINKTGKICTNKLPSVIAATLKVNG